MQPGERMVSELTLVCMNNIKGGEDLLIEKSLLAVVLFWLGKIQSNLTITLTIYQAGVGSSTSETTGA